MTRDGEEVNGGYSDPLAAFFSPREAGMGGMVITLAELWTNLRHTKVVIA